MRVHLTVFLIPDSLYCFMVMEITIMLLMMIMMITIMVVRHHLSFSATDFPITNSSFASNNTLVNLSNTLIPLSSVLFE